MGTTKKGVSKIQVKFKVGKKMKERTEMNREKILTQWQEIKLNTCENNAEKNAKDLLATIHIEEYKKLFNKYLKKELNEWDGN